MAVNDWTSSAFVPGDEDDDDEVDEDDSADDK